ncbi:exopolysaccharide biosynthesis protein [Alcanivorax marinus]|uniref:Exopolysaccharide biosynthesis protein n=1 Tax=Alloalcanivorax marinus TaxID=1177169 RepID=A0A9Q3YQP4_9GAMM|nr:exopolysaccharide biosynthesis protein [Alloalcanivorax marinus]MCC4310005.1 exopolysaccharide biosynthesis protein [Alloalcanivorax marinus]MCU5787900.1 exopolysaccharide synthesis, exoD [Alloalcanivorax marinus]
MRDSEPALGLTDILQELADRPDTRRLSLVTLVDTMQGRGFGPLLLVPALIVVLPTGALPGVPTLCALLIVLVAGQLVVGRRVPWLPARLRRVDFDRDRFRAMVDKARPWTERLDRLLKPRLAWLTRWPFNRVGALACLLLAVAMIPLELVPFAAAIPALIILLYALALAAHDGVLAVLGLAAMIAALAAAVWFWPIF